eukprot:TRINITY_DN58031_c0_g1_i1.p1 TRINITY_DN58031_c0_g1~~TRINITY_DN58031_c0_g1_i1.p1  ORF type:complete len:120 (+),score=9.42 TRINITY_DN58031_c0_g1_i1:149-508(+)
MCIRDRMETGGRGSTSDKFCMEASSSRRVSSLDWSLSVSPLLSPTDDDELLLCRSRCSSSMSDRLESSLLPVSYTHLRAHETPEHLVCRLLLEKKKNKLTQYHILFLYNIIIICTKIYK